MSAARVGRAMRRACITGGAGFIGSNLADRLSAQGVEVVIVDDFRTGRREFVAAALRRPGVRLVEGDVLDRGRAEDAIEGCDWVFHLQANADVRHGLEHPRRDLEQNTIATANVLEAMRARAVTPDRVLLDRLGLRRARGVPHARGRAVPGPDLALRRLQARRRGPDRGIRRRLRLHRRDLPLRLDPRRALHPRARRSTSTARCKRDPTRLRGARRRPPGEVLPVRRGLPRRDAASPPSATTTSPARTSTTSAPTRRSWSTTRSRIIAEHLVALAARSSTPAGRAAGSGDSPLIQLDTARIRALGWRPPLTIAQAIVRTLEWLDANEYAWRERWMATLRAEPHTPCRSRTGLHTIGEPAP